MVQLAHNMIFRWFVGLSMDKGDLGCDGVHKKP